MNWKLRSTGLLIVALAGILMAGGKATAQKPDSKDEKPLTKETAMLAKVFFKYHGMDALSQKLHGKMTLHMGEVDIKVDFESTLISAQPNQFRIVSKVTFLGEEKHGTVYSDGKSVWDWDEDAKQYSVQPFEPIIKDSDKFTGWVMDRAGVDMTLIFFLQAANYDALKLPKGIEKMNLESAIEIKNYPTQEIDGTKMYLVPVPKDGKKGGKLEGAVTLYVDAKEMLVRRMQMNIKFDDDKNSKDKSSMEMLVTYDAIKSDTKLTDQDFTFTPPADATKVDLVKPVFSRAFDR